MKIPIPTLDDFPANEANCGNCTRQGGGCPRNRKNKNKQHNGLLYGYNAEVTGIIYKCPNYTGEYTSGPELENY